MSKHQTVIGYIRELKEGERISVRGIADVLNVSEGTAYKAIKDAEKLGIVTTIPRVGTVRVDKIEKKNIQNLNCNNVVNIVNGSVLGGKAGLYKSINNFVIGAMTVDEMEKYLGNNDLLIAGNREEAHKLALENNCAVLITGGFTCSDYVKRLADRKQLPIISCRYDTFTTATLINNAMSQRKIKSDIILAEDIMKTNFLFLDLTSTVGDLKAANIITGETYFYIIDEKGKLIGAIDYIEGMGSSDDDLITSYIQKNLVCVSTKTSVSYAAHILLKNDLERVPVLEGKRMVGILLKEEVEKTLKKLGHRDTESHTIEEVIEKSFEKKKTDKGVVYTGTILPEMINKLGIASWNVLNLIMSITGISALTEHKVQNILLDTFNTIFIKPLQMDSPIEVRAEIIDIGKVGSKVEVSLNTRDELIGKAYLTTKVLGK